MYWRRASIHDGQASPGDATVLKRFFHDNFVNFRRRSKRIAFLESVNFLRVPICKFSIFVMSRDHFSAPFRGLYSAKCQMPGHKLSRLAKGTPSESRLSISTIDLGKTVFCRLCAGQSKGSTILRTTYRKLLEGYPQKAKNAGVGSGYAHATFHATKFRNFSR